MIRRDWTTGPILVMGGVVSALLAALTFGCDTRLEMAERTFACSAPGDCAPGYRCQGATSGQMGVCVEEGNTIEQADAADAGRDTDPPSDAADIISPSDAADITSPSDADADPSSGGGPILAMGTEHACATLAPDRIYCWGRNHHGQLGTGQITSTSKQLPVAVDLPTDEAFAMSPGSLDAAHHTTCAVTVDGKVFCWGSNQYGQAHPSTGGPEAEPVSEPTLVSTGSHVFKSVSGGFKHVCGLTEANAILCWGINARGQLGSDVVTNNGEVLTPAPVDSQLLQADEVFTQVQAASAHTCARSSANKIYCWGDNEAKELGVPGLNEQIQPQPIESDRGDIPSGSVIAELASSGAYNCVRSEQGDVYCWGGNDMGQCGIGEQGNDVPQPTRVVGGIKFEHVATGVGHACGVNTDGETYCWGGPDGLPLGKEGLTRPATEPITPVEGGHVFSRLELHVGRSCGVTTDAEIYCWGSDIGGVLGNDDDGDSYVPQQVVFPVE